MEGKTLAEITGSSEFSSDTTTHLVSRINELLNVPINKLEVEDVRLLASQQIALQEVVPLAIGFLENNLFAEGDYYEGDLLKSLLEIEEAFWMSNDPLYAALHTALKRSFWQIENIDLSENIKLSLVELVKRFQRLKGS